MSMIQAIRSSLEWKLILIIFATIFITVTGVSTFSFIKSSEAIDNDVVRFSNQILKQANLNLSRYIRDNEQFFRTISGSREFQDWLKIGPDDPYGLFDSYQKIEKTWITPFSTYHPETLSIKLYNENGNESTYRNEYMWESILAPYYSMKNESWLTSMDLTGKFSRYYGMNDQYTDKAGRSKSIPILTYAQKFRFAEQNGYLAIDISLLATQEILNEIQLGEHGLGMIVDQFGSIVSYPDPAQINTKLDPSIFTNISSNLSGSYYSAKSKQMIVYQTITGTDLKVIVIVPYGDLAKSISNIRHLTITLTIAGLLIASILAYLTSHSITRRLKQLRRTIKMTKLDQFDVRAQVSGIDEVAELASAYNLLLDRIENAIIQLAETRLVQQHAVLSALQSQINSHFLYNALESINSMAHLAEQPDIQQTTIALSNMLRYTSNYQQTIVTVKDEFDHLKNYFFIIRILYGDNISLSLEQDSSVEDAQCLKAIIQPFVENSVKHAYEVTGDRLLIRISTTRWKDRYVQIVIEDNGIGFTEERLNTIQQALSMGEKEQDYMRFSRIGVLNVHYRLKMFYTDSETGVYVERLLPEGGTRVIIRFPYRSLEGVIT
jgi:two-component system sensor histidine kinase YesM